jgi:hypothetical protein
VASSEAQLDATFRLRRWYRNLGLAGVIGYAAWAVLGAFVVATDSKIVHPVAAAALMVGVPLFMTGVSVWVLLAYRLEMLTIRGTRIISRGVIRCREIDLTQVTAARWRPGGREGGIIALRTELARIVIHLENYETEERAVIVQHLRSVLCPEVQAGWNLFAYKTALLEPRSVRMKPGPREILFRRQRWDRYLLPSLVVAALGGIVAWKILGQAAFLAAPFFPLAAWALMRATTPAEGRIAKKLSSIIKSDTDRFLPFLLVWFFVAVAGVIAHGVFRPGQTDLDVFTIAGGAVWFAVLLFEAGRTDRRQRRRDREAADLAAKARGEALVNTWQTES